MSTTDEERRRELGRRIKQRYQELGWSVEQLADKAGYDEKTVRNAINGAPIRPSTLLAIRKALNLDLSDDHPPAEIADDPHGGYTKKAFTKYVGRYAAHRWSYETPRHVMRTLFTLAWSSKSQCGMFREEQPTRIDSAGRQVNYSQSGEVFASNDAGVLHLLTIADGLLRLITITKLQPPDPVMRGSVLTQSRRTFYQQPAVSPMFLEKLDAGLSEDDASRLVGEVVPADSDYARIATMLGDVERDIVLCMFAREVPKRRRDDRPDDNQEARVLRLQPGAQRS